jgi:glycosyltransferase involved in cell wall biosynthesis
LNNLVSIVVPCHNQGIYLADALDSVLAQDYPHWECIVVNDASTDNSVAVAKTYLEKDKRFRLLSTPQNLKLPGARNFGIRAANGVYILPLDADDKITPTYCRRAMEVFTEFPNVKLVYGNGGYFGEMNGPWLLPEYRYAYLFSRNPIHCAAFFKKVDWEAVGGYDESFINSYEDWDLWLSLINENDKVVQLKEIGLLYRKRQHSMSSQFHSEHKNITESYRQLVNKHLEKFRYWQENRVFFFMEAYELQKLREQKIRANVAARILYGIAKWLSR